jgi:hypothetical protein
MTKSCSLCQDPRRKEIDQRLLNMELSKETYRRLSSHFGIHEASLRRHKKNCLTVDLGTVKQAMEEAREQALAEVRQKETEEIKAKVKESISGRLELAGDFFEQLKILRERAAMALEKAEGAEDLKTILQAVKELREMIRLWAELEGKLQAQPQITIINNPEWVELRSLIITALESYPAAREAVVLAIRKR